MHESVYRYVFRGDTPMVDVEETLILSIFAAEGLHGEARVRTDAAYTVSHEKRGLVIDAGTTVGRDVTGIFTALAMKEFGSESFQVERIRKKARDHAPEPSRKGDDRE
jgi:hypothetical protein